MNETREASGTAVGDNQGARIPKMNDGGDNRHEKELKGIFLRMGIIQGLTILFALFIVAAYGKLDPFLLKACAALFLCVHFLLWFGFWRLLVFMRVVNKNFTYQSFVDELTGLFNYRYLQRRMDEEQNRVDRYGGELAVLFMDLDNFKKVNDLYGHRTGNTVLRDLAELVRDQTRGSDIVGRMGGDEFIILLPNTRPDAAHRLGERITKAIDNYALENRGDCDIEFLGISIGIAVYSHNGETVDGVLEAADHALYESKDAGGDTVTVSHEFVQADTQQGQDINDGSSTI